MRQLQYFFLALVVTGVVALGVLVQGPYRALASELQASSTPLAVDEDGLSPAERTSKAKDDLQKALDLSLKKVDSLRVKLNDLKFPEDSREEELRLTYLKDLNAYAQYYNGADKKLSQLETLDEIKDLARNVKEYRDTTYSPGGERVVRFILVFYNEEVLGIANDRYNKIEADIRKLEELEFIKKGVFNERMGNAKDLLAEAADLQRQAKEMALNSSSGILVKGKPVSVKDLLEKSLNNIKSVYGIFLDLNQATKKTLGL